MRRLIAGVVVLVGCAPVAAPRAAPARAELALHTMSSDAWTRARTLRGDADPACERVIVECDALEGVCRSGPVSREGATFTANIALAIGENAIAVRCVAGERELAIERVVWRVPEVLRHPLPHATAIPPRAPWIARAVIYGAVPQLIGARGLADVEARLDTLAALGVDTLWLSPIHPSPEGDYGYAVTDPFGVRDEIGGAPALRSLVQASHARGMRVLLDLVPNHLSAEHPYFVAAERWGARSPYYRYFDRDPSGAPTHYFDWVHLPNLDYDHPEVRTMMASVFAYWVREFDIDGYRIDAAWGPRQRTPEFFRELAPRLYALDAELLLIAEASARDPYWAEIGFGAAYDWTDEVGHWAWREAFGEDEIEVAALRRALEAPVAITPLRFLDNNDTGERFVGRHGLDAYAAASALLFALPGIPALFTGDEFAADYSPYELEEPLPPQDDPDAHAALARRIALRRSERALIDGALVVLEAEPADGVLAFARRIDGDEIVVVIELSGSATTARVRTPVRPDRDLLSGERVRPRRRGRDLEIELAPYSARMLADR